ncbi:MAG: lipopolysaccharide biosynthesis [Ramlibacter sp.]|nr:lipopolysaccharide biosynthesis [Ramlibacter sp.]
MTLAQFFSILRARWVASLMILVATLALALAWIALRPTQYTARTAVLVDVRSDPVSGASVPGMIAPSYMATQIDIARSDRVAQRVVQMLQLDRSPEATRQWQEATQGKGSSTAWFARELQASLDVKPARDTNIISIAYTGSTPDEAKRITDAFAQAYLDTSLELKTEPARRYAAWFEEQLGASRKNLEAAQARLTEYQQRAGIVTDNQAMDFETARLNDISAQLTTVQGQTTETQNKRGGMDTVSDVMQSPLINSLKTDVLKLETKIQESGANLGPSHPQMVRAQAELAALRSRLASETARIGTSIDTAYRVGKGRERELQGALAAQKARVLAINRQRGEHAVLVRELESAQRAYETVSTSTSQARLQSLTNQTNVMRLAPADEPITPTGPSGRQVLLIAAIGGLLLAIAGALLLELVRRRVRSVMDLSAATRLPVLAIVPGSPRAISHRFTPVPSLALGNRSVT